MDARWIKASFPPTGASASCVPPGRRLLKPNVATAATGGSDSDPRPRLPAGVPELRSRLQWGARLGNPPRPFSFASMRLDAHRVQRGTDVRASAAAGAVSARSVETNMDLEEIKTAFGFDPKSVGNRHRGFWIVDELDSEERFAGAQVGDLCIKSRDGASNPPDCKAGSFGKFVGTSEDRFDPTYRYYYYCRLDSAVGKP